MHFLAARLDLFVQVLGCMQFMSNPGASIFFIVFITVCSFCLLNLYVGVVFFQFSRIRAHAETGTRNTEDEQLQQQWLELAKLAFRTKAREIPPQQGIQLRAAARTIALSKRFDGVIMVCVLSANSGAVTTASETIQGTVDPAVQTIVCLNVFIMAVTTYDQGEMKSLVLERVNLVRSWQLEKASVSVELVELDTSTCRRIAAHLCQFRTCGNPATACRCSLLYT